MEDSGGTTPAMDNNSSNKRSFGQHYNAIVSLRFVMAISLTFVGGFTVKRFSAVDPSPEHIMVDTTHSYNADKLYDFEDVFTRTRDDNVVKEPPHGWQTFGFLQIREHFLCDQLGLDINIVEKPVPIMKKWQMILDAYNKEVDSSYKFDEVVPPTQGYLFDKIGAQYNNEGAPPFYAESTNMGRRRGLFASRDIQVGEVVHDGINSDVVFPDAMAYRRFVFALPRRAECDITEWTWTQRLKQDGPMKIMLAINASAMLSTSFPSEEANVLPETSTSQLYYAIRISRGERKSSLTRLSEIRETLQQLILV